MDKQQLIRQMRTADFNNIYGQEALAAIAKADTQIVRENESLAALCNEGDFFRVYWGITDKNDIAELNAKLSAWVGGKPYISEIIFRKHEPAVIADFLRAGMVEYSRLIFMIRALTPPRNLGIFTQCWHNLEICCEKAKLDDVEAIYQLLWKNFDSLISHLPDYAQIIELINKKEINVLRVNGKIAVVAIFQIMGRCSKYWYQLITAPDYRGQGLADCLLLNELLQNGADYSYSLWVEKNNYKAMSMHKKHGFVDAGRELIILRGN